MKKILLFALMFLSASSVVLAQSRNRSLLKLRLSDRTPLSVIVDGRHFDEGSTTITIGNLPAGPHRIEVFSEGGYRMRPRRVYTGTSRVAPGMVYIGTVDIYNRGLRLRTRPIEAYAQDGGGRGKNADRDNEYTDDKGGRYSVPETNRDDRNINDDIYDDNRSGDYQDNNKATDEANERVEDKEYGRRIFTQSDMTDLRTRVNNRITDSDKEQLMKRVLQSRSASTAQIREMLGWLSFESTRLDFAKWAFSRVTDRRNYWKLEDVFTFSSSKTEFNEAISGR
jgi:hypothetical protein